MYLVNIIDPSKTRHRNKVFARIPMVGELVKFNGENCPVTQLLHHWQVDFPIITIALGKPLKGLAAFENDEI